MFLLGRRSSAARAGQKAEGARRDQEEEEQQQVVEEVAVKAFVLDEKESRPNQQDADINQQKENELELGAGQPGGVDGARCVGSTGREDGGSLSACREEISRLVAMNKELRAELEAAQATARCARRASVGSTGSTSQLPSKKNKRCYACGCEFRFYTTKQACLRCSETFCTSCCRDTAVLDDDKWIKKTGRCCAACTRELEEANAAAQDKLDSETLTSQQMEEAIPKHHQLSKLFSQFMQDQGLADEVRVNMEAMDDRTKWIIMQTDRQHAKKPGRKPVLSASPSYWLDLLGCGLSLPQGVALNQGDVGSESPTASLAVQAAALSAPGSPVHVHPRELAALRVKLGTADKEWIAQFVALGGFTALLTFMSAPSCTQHTEALAAVSSFVANPCGYGLQTVSESLGAVTSIVALFTSALDSVRLRILHLLEEICCSAEMGRQAVVAAFQSPLFERPYGILVQPLQQGDEPDLMLGVLRFLNQLLALTWTVEDRISIRRCLFDAQMLPALNNLHMETDARRGTPEYPRFAAVVEASSYFMRCNMEDRREVSCKGVDLSDPNQVWFHLRQTAMDEGHSAELLGILHHLLAIPNERHLSSEIWNNILRVVRAATIVQDVDKNGHQSVLGMQELMEILQDKVEGKHLRSKPKGHHGAPGPLPQSPRTFRLSPRSGGSAPSPAPAPGPPPAAPGPPPASAGGVPGAPPPPPMAPGMVAAVPEWKKLGLYEKRVVNPSVKMRVLHWKIIPLRKIKTTLWQRLTDQHVVLDTEELEKGFCVAGRRASVVTLGDEQEEEAVKKVAQEKTTFLDPRRSSNMVITLARFKMSHEDIRDAIIAMDHRLLDLDKLLKLVHCMPTEDDRRAMKNHSEANLDTLATAERWCMVISDIPRPDIRLECFVFKLTFEDLASELEADLELMSRTQDSILDHLTPVLELMLATGNYINAGSKKGQAYGVQLETLLLFKTRKDTDNRHTLLHYVVELVRTRYPHARELLACAEDVAAACRIDLKVLGEEVKRISRSLTKLGQELQIGSRDPADRFVEVMTEFYEMAKFRVSELVHFCGVVATRSDELVVGLGEDPVSTSIDDVLGILNTFLQQYACAEEELEKEEQEQRQRKAKALRSSAAATLGPGKHARAAGQTDESDEQSGGESSGDERLLEGTLDSVSLASSPERLVWDDGALLSNDW